MLVYIKPLSIFPELHSDTLFGAITYAISELYPNKIDELLNEFKSQPPFLLTSPFPVAFLNDKSIKFYPKLIIKSSDEIRHDINLFKKYKKVNYLEEDIFFKLVNGDLTEEDILNNFDKYHYFNGLLMRDRKSVV